MLDRFYTDIADTHRTELMQYCKMENVLPASLVCDSKQKLSIKLRLKTTAFHLLQRIDKRLNIMIRRLSNEMEHSVMVHGRLS